MSLDKRVLRQQNMTSVKRIYLLYLQTVLITAGPGAQYRMHKIITMNHINLYVTNVVLSQPS